MNPTIQKGLETFGIGLGVVIVSAVIQYLTNYHPTGEVGTYWAVGGVAIIGGLRALLSWLIVKQNLGNTPAAKKGGTT
jgi:hypothetical protein